MGSDPFGGFRYRTFPKKEKRFAKTLVSIFKNANENISDKNNATFNIEHKRSQRDILHALLLIIHSRQKVLHEYFDTPLTKLCDKHPLII